TVAAAAATWLDELGYTPAEAAVLAAAAAHAPELPPPSALLSARDPRCDPPGPSCLQPVGRVLYYKHLRPMAVADAGRSGGSAAAAAAAASAVLPPSLPNANPDVAMSAAELPGAPLTSVPGFADHEGALFRRDIAIVTPNEPSPLSSSHVVAPVPMDLPYIAAPNPLTEPSGRTGPAAVSPFACPTAAAYIGREVETAEAAAAAAVAASGTAAMVETGMAAVADASAVTNEGLGALVPSTQPLMAITREGVVTTSGTFQGLPFPDGSGSLRTMETYGTPYGLELAALIRSPDSLLLVSGVNSTSPAALHQASAPATTTAAAVDPVAAMDGAEFGATHGSKGHHSNAAEDHVLECITAAVGGDGGGEDQLPASSIIGEVLRTYFETIPAHPPPSPQPLPCPLPVPRARQEPSLHPQVSELSSEHQALEEGKLERRGEEAKCDHDEAAAAQLGGLAQQAAEFRQPAYSEEAAHFERMVQWSNSTPHLDTQLMQFRRQTVAGTTGGDATEDGLAAATDGAVMTADATTADVAARSADETAVGACAVGTADHLDLPMIPPVTRSTAGAVVAPSAEDEFVDGGAAPGAAGPAATIPTASEEAGRLIHAEAAGDARDASSDLTRNVDAAAVDEIATAEANPVEEPLAVANANRAVGFTTAAAAAALEATAAAAVPMAAAATAAAPGSVLQVSPTDEGDGGGPRRPIRSLSHEGSDAVPVMSVSTGSVVLCGDGITLTNVDAVVAAAAAAAASEGWKGGAENAAASGAAVRPVPWVPSDIQLHQLPASSVVRGRSAVRDVVPEPSGDGGGGSTSAETSTSQQVEAAAAAAEVAAAVGQEGAASASVRVVTAVGGPCEADAVHQRSSRTTTSPAVRLAVSGRSKVVVAAAEVTPAGEKVG
ncbi:hypothetical protein Vretimale_9950, partial [Volvox reticuliferus]